MTHRNPTPPGMDKNLSFIDRFLTDDAARAVTSVEPAPTPKEIKAAHDWLKSDHQRTEMLREMTQLKRGVGRVENTQKIWVAVLMLMFFMQLLRWWFG